MTWDLVVSRWLLCLFVDVLPIETVLRIWDVLFNEGEPTLNLSRRFDHRLFPYLIKQQADSTNYFRSLLEEIHN